MQLPNPTAVTKLLGDQPPAASTTARDVHSGDRPVKLADGFVAQLV